MALLSARSAFAPHGDGLAHALAAARDGGGLIDLTETNPTRAGLAAPELVALLGHPRGARYEPDARGDPAARAAIARDLAARGGRVDADRLVLSASTSESYAWLFKLLCDPGDEVLVPVPSYPLFEILAKLEGAAARPFVLEKDERFAVDPGAVARALGPRTRALVLVHPNNPTGTMASPREAEALRGVLAARGVALVVDEVFADWVLEGEGRLGTFAACGDDGPLTFVLGGLSKSLLLPQVKLGWIAVTGEGHAEALRRLEWIADAFLSASAPAQLALPELLSRRAAVQAPVLARLRANLAALDLALAPARAAGVRRLAVHGGWSAVVEVPRTRGEEDWCRAALGAGVAVSPGFFFDFPSDGHLVVSLLPPPAAFAEGASRLAAVLARDTPGGSR